MTTFAELFPLFLKLTGRKVLVVGGGKVAAAKLKGLLDAGADVTLVAPEVVSEIEQAPITIVRRGFEPADLDGAWLAVAAAPPAINREVLEAAEGRTIFVNAVDDPAHATAYAAGVLRRGGLTLAISTNGRAPALAGLLREALEHVLPKDIDQWLEQADAARAEWRRERIPMNARRPLLLQALNDLYRRLPPDVRDEAKSDQLVGDGAR